MFKHILKVYYLLCKYNTLLKILLSHFLFLDFEWNNGSLGFTVIFILFYFFGK